MTDVSAKKKSVAKTATKKATRSRSRQIVARRSLDAEFMALLRRKCVRAASIGALTAGAEAIPGLGRALGFLFGEMVDATMLSNVQRELIEDTFAIYGFAPTSTLRRAFVDKIRVVGAGASVATDTAIRGLLRRRLGRAGSMLPHRVMPLAPVVTSALTNAAITYTIGKRAQAVAKGGSTDLTDVVRAFTGFDERRVVDWTMAAIRGSTGSLSSAFAKVKANLMSRRAKKKPTARGARSA